MANRSIGFKLELKQVQKLLMTPSLQMAIKLLQLTKLDLAQVVRQELVENPMLEEVPDATSEDEALPEDIQLSLNSLTEPESEAKSDNDGMSEDNSLSDVDWQQYFSDDDTSTDNYSTYENKEATPSWEGTLAKSPSLQEHLLWQLRLATHTPEEQEIGETIIGNIDDNGYLRSNVQEIAEVTGSGIQETSNILKLIQSFEPTGIGSANLEECLLSQVKGNQEEKQLIQQIIRHHLVDLEKKKFPNIANKLKITLKRVVELANLIAGYDPKPGRQYNAERTRYVIPDVFVYKLGEEYVVVINDEGIPRLRISNLYKKILKQDAGATPKARKYVEEKFRSAMWLIKSIQQRQTTLYKVTTSIVNFQRGFLDNGVSGLRPLTLKDVASDISMHESTVSRVTTDKYVQTPRGIFELKYFFHSGLTTNSGRSMSSMRIRDMIKKIVDAEDKAKPLTDIQIHRILEKQGISIARRTITKYREALNIGAASRRREY